MICSPSSWFLSAGRGSKLSQQHQAKAASRKCHGRDELGFGMVCSSRLWLCVIVSQTGSLLASHQLKMWGSGHRCCWVSRFWQRWLPTHQLGAAGLLTQRRQRVPAPCGRRGQGLSPAHVSSVLPPTVPAGMAQEGSHVTGTPHRGSSAPRGPFNVLMGWYHPGGGRG